MKSDSHLNTTPWWQCHEFVNFWTLINWKIAAVELLSWISEYIIEIFNFSNLSHVVNWADLLCFHALLYSELSSCINILLWFSPFQSHSLLSSQLMYRYHLRTYLELNNNSSQKNAEVNRYRFFAHWSYKSSRIFTKIKFLICVGTIKKRRINLNHQLVDQ